MICIHLGLFLQQQEERDSPLGFSVHLHSVFQCHWAAAPTQQLFAVKKHIFP